jgi:PTH1 family peptidyl-tRNA hydrolase
MTHLSAEVVMESARVCRIGIRHPGHASRVTGHVLGAPSKADRERIDACIDEAIAALPLLLDGDSTKAMTRLHSFSAA